MQNQQLVVSYFAKNRIDYTQQFRAYLARLVQFSGALWGDAAPRQHLPLTANVARLVAPRLGPGPQAGGALLCTNYLLEAAADQSALLQLQLVNAFVLRFVLAHMDQLQHGGLKLVYDQQMLGGTGITMYQLHKLELWQEVVLERLFGVEAAKLEGQAAASARLRAFV